MIFTGNSKISGVGSFIPPTVVSSADVLEDLKSESKFGIPFSWLGDSLGIESKRHCEDNEKPSNISCVAALRAVEDSGLDPKDIGAIIYCGITGDFIEPGTAHIIQNQIGATKAICKDVSNACHGFCDGMLFADLLIGAGVDHVLVVTAELTRASRMAHPVLKKEMDINKFYVGIGALSVGDAAGAMVLSRKDRPDSGILSINTVSDGNFADLCNYNIQDGVCKGSMVMDKISRVTLRQCIRQLTPTLRKVGWSCDEIKHFVVHQVGKKPYNTIKKMSKFNPENMPKTYDYLGNVTTATIPINFEIIKKSGKFRAGDKTCLLGTGSGIVLSWFCIAI